MDSPMPTLALLAAIAIVTAVPASSEEEPPVVKEFRKLGKGTHWHPAAEIKLQFSAYHPQGMVIIGDRIFFSTVQVFSRVANTGAGRLYETNRKGEMVKAQKIGEGAMYHPGGIDYDGERLWVPVAEYRPNSRSIVYHVDPNTFEATEVFRFNDHLGAIVFNREERELWGVSWGSRRFYTWPVTEDLTVEEPSRPESASNGSHYIDYQDCHYVGGGYALCGGLNAYKIVQNPQIHFALGGLDLIDLSQNQALHQIAVPKWVRPRLVMTNNPFYYEMTGIGLRFYFMPEDDEAATIYVYDARP